MNIIRRLDCVETPKGVILTWDFAEGAEVVRTTVYGIQESRQFLIESPLIPTGRFILAPSNYHLVTSFKVSATLRSGEVEISEPISPRRLPKEQRLILTDLARRLELNMKAAPIGLYTADLLLRRLDGQTCERCSPSICAGMGGTAASNNCPICFGTGIVDPYLMYEKPVIMWGATADDDQPVEGSPVGRIHKMRTFFMPFVLHVRPDDLLVTGTEVYKVLRQDVTVSVGGVPVQLVLSVLKYEPHDERQPLILNKIRNERSGI